MQIMDKNLKIIIDSPIFEYKKIVNLEYTQHVKNNNYIHKLYYIVATPIGHLYFIL